MERSFQNPSSSEVNLRRAVASPEDLPQGRLANQPLARPPGKEIHPSFFKRPLEKAHAFWQAPQKNAERPPSSTRSIGELQRGQGSPWRP